MLKKCLTLFYFFANIKLPKQKGGIKNGMISIKMYRGKAGLTQSQLAELIGVPRTYLATLEKSDYHLVPKSNVLKIAEVLNISAIELFGIDNLKIKPKNNEEIKQLIKILLSELKEDDKNEFIKEMEKL